MLFLQLLKLAHLLIVLAYGILNVTFGGFLIAGLLDYIELSEAQFAGAGVLFGASFSALALYE